MKPRFTSIYLLVAAAFSPSFAFAETPLLDEIVVTAARQPQQAGAVLGDVTVIEREQIDSFGNSDLNTLLSQQAGVQLRSNGGAGKVNSLYLRGANGNQIVVLIDGVRYGSATTGAAALQNMPLDQIERIEILRGPAASLYGADAIGGAIQIFTRRGSGAITPSVSVGYGTQNTVETSASVAGSTGASRFALGLAYSRTDGISALAAPGNAPNNTDKDGYENLSLSLSGSHQINERHEFGGSLLMAWSENHYDNAWTTAPYDYRDESRNGAATVWTRNTITDIWTSKLQYGISLDDSDNYQLPSAWSAEKSTFKTTQNQIGWQNDIALGAGSLLLALESLEQRISSTEKYAVDHRRINSVLGGYQAQLGTVNLQLNLRSDDNSQFGRNNSGSAALAWQITPGWQLGASYGTGYRAPNFNELYYPGFGNPELKPEESRNTEAFLRYQSARLQAGVTAYHNRLTDLLQYNPATYTTDNIGKATLQGVTLNLDWQGEVFNAGGNLDWLDATNTTQGRDYNKQLAYRAEFSGFAYAGLHGNDWTARLELQGMGSRYDDPANTIRLAGYGLVNVAASWQVARDWSLTARVNNLLDKDYVQATGYATQGINGLLSVRWQPK
ncbi:TonB-dependent receptor domain-containing protein [Chitinilyticum aquatile]|uniref:TonB-dependent receptor domain-containing protein n=1 Tax=Chitinilyticum aquatile TaxID=362520 RepID=UPI0003F6306C|nr:TonB-dependent receptor [Chitinilyticum aquatile]